MDLGVRPVLLYELNDVLKGLQPVAIVNGQPVFMI